MGHIVPDPSSGKLTSSVLNVNALIKWCVQVRYWALWTIWAEHNVVFLGQQLLQPYGSFRASLQQSLYDACHQGDLNTSYYGRESVMDSLHVNF